jgi:hypothetical protein
MPTLTRLMPTRHCPSCGDERAFEVPPCRDCGAALLVNPPAPVRSTSPALGAAA